MSNQLSNPSFWLAVIGFAFAFTLIQYFLLSARLKKTYRTMCFWKGSAVEEKQRAEKYIQRIISQQAEIFQERRASDRRIRRVEQLVEIILHCGKNSWVIRDDSGDGRSRFVVLREGTIISEGENIPDAYAAALTQPAN